MNNNNIYGFVNLPANPYGTGCCASACITLNPNDYFEIFGYQNSGGNLNTGDTSQSAKHTNRIQIVKLYI